MAERARRNVDEGRGGEAEEGHAAEHHQELFERVERAPFEVTLTFQNEPVPIADAHTSLGA
jgi:hypothetical protein